MGNLKDIHKLQDRADKIMAHEGSEKGLGLLNAGKSFQKVLGEERLKQVEQGMEELGYPFSFNDLNRFGWYQSSYLPLAFTVAKFLFDIENKEVFDIGKLSATQSPILRTVMRLVSMQHAYDHVSRLWGTHFDFGAIESVKYDKEKNRMVLRVYDYHYEDVGVPFLRGYFAGFTDRVTGEESEVTASSCDPSEDYQTCDEYLLEW